LILQGERTEYIKVTAQAMFKEAPKVFQKGGPNLKQAHATKICTYIR
jgi:hypothetical protein